jgi:septum site-determining protein MinC
MVQKQIHQNVMIKGTKDGLILFLDDTCSFDQLLIELRDKLHSTFPSATDGQEVEVSLQVGNRYLTYEQEKTIRDIILNKKNLAVNFVESNVITKKEALELKKNMEVHTVSRVIRSGQVVQVTGDMLLIGDVNPGGCVIATGNIFVLGSLRGIAHAGYKGNSKAIISASHMEASQLRIAGVTIQIDHSSSRECAYIDENTGDICFEDINLIHKLKPELNRI